MISKNTLFYILISFVFSTITYAQEFVNSKFDTHVASIVTDNSFVCLNNTQIVLQDSLIATTYSIIPVVMKDSLVYPPPYRDWRRLGYDSTLYAGAAVVVFGILFAMPESFTHWDKEAMKENGILWKWKQNVKAGPVIDQDSFFINYITHPYSGAVYYMTARSCGFTIFESFGYSAMMSTFFWEYGIEAFAEIPSTQDLISTPILGSALGEGFFYAKKSIVKHDKRVLKSKFLGYTSLFLLDPFNTILDGFGYKEKVKTQMNITPVGVNQFTKNPVWGVQFSASF